MHKTYSPLRYPGGKAKLGPWLANLIQANKIEECCYIEPYAGGAGAALYLLLSKQVKRIVINDADPAIYALWYAILFDTDNFIQKIESTVIDINTWKIQKQIISDPNNNTLTDLGFSAFFLNRTNVSGVIKGGVIGGKDQTGKYKIDARFNKTSLIKRIKLISEHRDQITIYNEDAVDFLEITSKILPSNSIIYFDPPYYVKGSQLYRNHYKHDDHKEIAEKIKSLPFSWIVTYDNCEQIKNLYSGCEGFEFSLRYTVSKSRQIATELMFYGNIEIYSLPHLIA